MESGWNDFKKSLSSEATRNVAKSFLTGRMPSTKNRTKSSRPTTTPQKLAELAGMLRAHGELSESRFQIWGELHVLVAFDDHCLIVRGSVDKNGKVRANLITDATTLTFFYADINAVEVQSPGEGVYLTLVTASYSGSYRPLTTDIDEAINFVKMIWDPGKAVIWDQTMNKPDNVIPMSREQYDEQKHLVQELKKLIGKSKGGDSHAGNMREEQQNLLTSELKRLHEMRESGIIDDVEFSAAKKKLLS